MTTSSVSSMTAFSRQESNHDWGSIAWEIRSVNHRYLEANFRIPEAVRVIEGKLRETLRKQLSRGKVDCSLQLKLNTAEQTIQLDSAIIDQYLQAINTINERTENPTPVNGLDLLFKPGVILQDQLNNDVLTHAVLDLFNKAIAEHIEHRQREGAALNELIQQRLEKISESVIKVRPMIPEIIQQQREKIHNRLAELKEQMDEGRIEQEITLLANRADVDEELDRLDTHIIEVKRALETKGSIGRRLDFLMQELNREANTLSSKSMASETTLIAVDIKVLIEQMREQVQNIE